MFHEIKLFFIHEHFEVMDVQQMNQLIEIFLSLFHRSEYRNNPVLSCYNTVKYALLVFRVSWRIERMKIYSLITKCQLINKYILQSLDDYLRFQSNIAQLYKFMLEPVLDLNHSQDSLDIMLEMQMQRTLNHPVIIEVLNLVYEGRYSIDSSILSLSQTFWNFFNVSALD